MRPLTFVLALLFVIVQFQLWVGEDSLAGVWRLEQATKRQKQENVELRQRNSRLAAEVEDLKSGLAAVEERARRELGMVHKDETYFQIVDR